MNILDADFTLYEIEQTLEERFRMEEKMLRTIGDLDLRRYLAGSKDGLPCGRD